MSATLLALLFSGLVQALVSPPLNWAFLHPLAWVPAFWVFARLDGGRAFFAGWLVGTSANVAIFYWLAPVVNRFLGIPSPLAVLALLLYAAATGLYVALFAWGFQPIRRAAGAAWPLAIAAWFCALEFVNPQLFAYSQGAGWYQVPRVFLITSLTGVSGMSFLVMLCNAVAYQGLESIAGGGGARRRAFTLNAAGLLALVAAAVGYSTVRLAAVERAEAAARPLEIALIQPNTTIERRDELLRAPPGAPARDLVALSREAAARARRRVDAFVWPEGALQESPAAPHNVEVRDLARATGAEVWSGAYHRVPAGNGLDVRYNSAYRVGADGTVDGRYDKSVLVPFAEYVPLKDVVPGFDRIRLPGDFEAGHGAKVYSAGGARIAFLICYESIATAYVRTAVRQGANLLVNVSLDSWFGQSSELSQHLMLASIQSAQFGVPLVRSTTTGLSAFVDARGVITARTEMSTRSALVRTVRPVRVPSPYARYGDWFAWTCVAGTAVLLASAARRRPDRRRSPGAPGRPEAA